MRIVFLDKVNFQKPEECFDYSLFHQLGDVTFYDDTPPHLITERAKDADIVIVLKTALPATIITQLKKTKLICKIGSGYDRIDINAANGKNIQVTTFPGHAAKMVAQWTMSFIYMLAGNILKYDREVRNNNWNAVQFALPITELENKVLGIIGYGSIGKIVAQLAVNNGMKVMVNTHYPENSSTISFTTKEEIYQHADFISLHCRLNSKTDNMINKEVFKLMKPTCCLINTARAALVNKQDLFTALTNKTIAGAAMDGYWQEPPEKDDALFKLDNIIITPHVSWAAHSTRQLLLNHIGQRIKNYINGEQIPVVLQKST